MDVVAVEVEVEVMVSVCGGVVAVDVVAVEVEVEVMVSVCGGAGDGEVPPKPSLSASVGTKPPLI